MRKHLVLLFVLALCWPAPTRAVLCALDVVPARTLLLPYFEFDLAKLGKPKRTLVTTVTLTNSANAEVLVHVTFWTDMALPVMAYDIPIPPFGSQDIPLHDIYRGDIDNLPGKVPGSPVAPPGATTEDVVARQTGEPIDGACLTFPRGDNIARGYITFDVANVDGSDDPNVLTGVVTYSNRKRKNGSIEPLVHLEEGGLGETEPLGSVWSINYDLRSGSRTDLIVWQDPSSGVPVDTAALCDGPAENGWYPLTQVQSIVASKSGETEEILVDEDLQKKPGFPLATGRYRLGSSRIPVPFKSGTLLLNLNNTQQSWVGVRRSFGSSKRQGRARAVSLATPQCNLDN